MKCHCQIRFWPVGHVASFDRVTKAGLVFGKGGDGQTAKNRTPEPKDSFSATVAHQTCIDASSSFIARSSPS
jgi:hypothetical protein